MFVLLTQNYNYKTFKNYTTKLKNCTRKWFENHIREPYSRIGLGKLKYKGC